MKTKLFVILAACSLLLTIPAQAQDDSTSSRRRRPVEALKRVLELTDVQAQQFSELRQSHRLATEAQRAQIREWTSQIRLLEQQKNELLNSTSPDPGQIGSILIQQRGLRAQVRQARQDLAASFREVALGILDTTQQEKVAQIQQAVTLAPQARPLAAFGLIERPRQRRGSFTPQRLGGFGPQRRQRFPGTAGADALQDHPGMFLLQAPMHGDMHL
ncbi:MAG: hypothetical protein IH935_00855 [Acidobacteria bacterium]|nr:hypothetical protein [Acidobacteriota bacterium]